MRTFAKWTLAFLSISLPLCLAGDKGFQAGPPDEYPHQENDHVVIGGKPFDSETQTKAVFGKKTDLNRYGVLPVLVVIENKRSEALDLNGLEVKLVANGSSSIIPLEPQEVAGLANPASRPTVNTGPLPRRSRKNPLDTLDIVARAFTARMLPAGERSSGFFYFRARSEPGMRLLVSGIFERPSGKEILYFEIPL